ncbi:MAG: hypothetical protein IJX33_07965, partial [Akkermansia sp.]|nr:hypothetical protein [Akkermansia sp.]
VPGIINTKPSVPPRGGSTLGYYYAALTGSKFRYADAPQTTLQIPIYRDAGDSSKMLLVFLLLTKSLGDV